METQTDFGRAEVAPAVTAKSLVKKVEGSKGLKKRLRPVDEIIRALLLFCGVVSIFTTFGIIYVLGEESLLFFDSRAFTLAKAPVVDEDQFVTLAENIREDARVLTVTFDGERVPFANRQFLQVDGEVMRVVDRGRRTITVSRGEFGTEPASHSIETTLYGMLDRQIKPQNDLDLEATVIELESGFGQEFRAGDSIQLGQEIMRVESVTPDSLTVERAVDGTTARIHEANGETIGLAEEVTISEFLTGTAWQPQAGDFGIWPLLLATIIISTIAMLVSIPLGLGAAIYMSEYAAPRTRNVLKPILEVLAGIPTVVYGFFALTFVSPILQGVFGEAVRYQNMLAAGLVVGVLLVPIIASFSEDALRAVPRALREASYGLGATKLETTVKVVLPAAVSGIMAALILAVSRAVGETMIVAIAAGSGPNFTFNVFHGAETMTGHIARISGGDISYNSIDYNSIFAIGLVLFIVTFTLNIISTYVTDRFREQY